MMVVDEAPVERQELVEFGAPEPRFEASDDEARVSWEGYGVSMQSMVSCECRREMPERGSGEAEKVRKRKRGSGTRGEPRASRNFLSNLASKHLSQSHVDRVPEGPSIPNLDVYRCLESTHRPSFNDC